MSNEYVFIAKKIANDLLNIEFRGVGDTIEAAAVFEAYQNACKQAEQKYQIARTNNEIDPRLASLADFIAGYQGSKKNEKDNPQ